MAHFLCQFQGEAPAKYRSWSQRSSAVDEAFHPQAFQHDGEFLLPFPEEHYLVEMRGVLAQLADLHLVHGVSTEIEHLGWGRRERKYF